MKISRQNPTPTTVKLTITLESSELADAESVALAKLARDLKVPGFRKGKVPVTVAARHIEPVKLAEETLDNAVSKAVAEAFIKEDISVLERPQVELTKYVPGQSAEFTAEAEVVPPVKLGNYKKLKVPSEKATVAGKEIDDIIERMRSAMGEKKSVKRAAKLGDVVTIDFVGKKNDTAFDGGTAENYELELGSNSFIPGFEEGLIGLKSGDKKSLKLTFPDDYHIADLAGADVVFDTTLRTVSEKSLPKLDDAFAKKAGAAQQITTLEELKADIKRELTQQKEREAAEKHKDALVGKLVEVSEVPAPQVLVEDQTRSIEQDMRQNLMYQGATLDNYIRAQGFKDEADWRENEVIPAAEKRVKAGLVLAELSKELKTDVTADELAEFTARYKQQYANNPEMANRFDEPEVQHDLRNRLVTEKVVDQLVTLSTD